MKIVIPKILLEVDNPLITDFQLLVGFFLNNRLIDLTPPKANIDQPIILQPILHHNALIYRSKAYIRLRSINLWVFKKSFIHTVQNWSLATCLFSALKIH